MDGGRVVHTPVLWILGASGHAGTLAAMPLSETDEPILRIRRPGDVIETIPYLLGFHPHNSLVVIGLRERIVQVTARLDLADLPGGDISRQIERILHTLAQASAREVVAAVFVDVWQHDDHSVLPRSDLIAELADQLGDRRMELAEALLATGERWWSYLCANPDCCSPDGTALSGTSSLPAAAATFAGMVALEDRAALERMLAADPAAARLGPAIDDAETEAVKAILDGASKRWRTAAIRALLAAGRAADATVDETTGNASNRIEDRMSDDQLARFAVALSDIEVRDALWRAIDTRRLDARPLWQRLGTGLPAPYDAAPLFLFGWSAWRHGSGAIAGIAAQRALDSDPGYTAAELLLAALSQGVDPFRFPGLFSPKRRRRARRTQGATTRQRSA